MKPQDRIRYEARQHYFPLHLAIVWAMPWESSEEAWRRRLVQHPRDSRANVKIFNRVGLLFHRMQ